MLPRIASTFFNPFCSRNKPIATICVYRYDMVIFICIICAKIMVTNKMMFDFAAVLFIVKIFLVNCS